MDVIAPGSHERHDNAHRPRRIGLRPCDARYRRQRGSARCEMEKISTGKFHWRAPPDGRGRAMRAWIDRTNGGLSGMPADGISLPQKGDFGTSRWAARKLFYINHAPSRTGRLGSIYADEPAHRTPELARKACPVVER